MRAQSPDWNRTAERTAGWAELMSTSEVAIRGRGCAASAVNDDGDEDEDGDDDGDDDESGAISQEDTGSDFWELKRLTWLLVMCVK